MTYKITNRLEYIKQWAEDREKEKVYINKYTDTNLNGGLLLSEEEYGTSYFTTDASDIISLLGIQKHNKGS